MLLQYPDIVYNYQLWHFIYCVFLSSFFHLLPLVSPSPHTDTHTSCSKHGLREREGVHTVRFPIYPNTCQNDMMEGVRTIICQIDMMEGVQTLICHGDMMEGVRHLFVMMTLDNLPKHLS